MGGRKSIYVQGEAREGHGEAGGGKGRVGEGGCQKRGGERRPVQQAGSTQQVGGELRKEGKEEERRVTAKAV